MRLGLLQGPWLVFLVLFGSHLASARGAHPITMDGLFHDWSDVAPAYSDPSGDGIVEDLGELRITNDNNFVFFSLTYHDGEHLMQDWNEIHLYVDTDNNAETGLEIHGIGAELEWCFGCREGIFYSSTSSDSIHQNDLTLRSSPTVTSDRFEFCIARASPVMTLNGTQSADTIGIVFVETDPAGDVLPDDSGGIQYVIDTTYVAPAESIPLDRIDDAHIRLVTYNVLANGIFDPDRQMYFQRILPALNADVMALQEASGDSAEMATLIASWMPQSTWHVSPEYHGNLVVSKYPILDQAVLIESQRSMAVLLDTEGIAGKNLLILNSHFSCCGWNESRQHDADELIGVLREWRSGNGPFELPSETPLIHVGDFNLVGYRQQLITLTEGDILDQETFGEDFSPDWDGTPITDLFSRHTAIRMGYTWRSDWSSFSPGKLDYIIYTDSVLDIGRHFVLNTLAMSETDLANYGLEPEDTNLASDHLPRVIDIAGVHAAKIGGGGQSGIPQNFKLFPAYPNPFNMSVTIRYDLPEASVVILTIYDLMGRQVAVLVDSEVGSGRHQARWNGTDEFGQPVSVGTYFYQLRAKNLSESLKMILLK